MSTKRQSLSEGKKMLTLSEAMNLMVLQKEIEGKSPQTTNWYRRRLTRFVKFTGDIPVKDLGLQHGQQFILYLSKNGKYPDHPKHKQEEEPISRATLRNYTRAIKGFASFLFEEGYTKDNVFAKLKVPKDDKRVIEVLSVEEIHKLYGEINPNSRIGSRMFLVVTILLDTGIRIGELVGIEINDIDFKQSRIKVTGKGSIRWTGLSRHGSALS